MSTCDIRYTCMYIRVYIYIHICIYISRCIRDVQMKSKFRRMKILTLTNTYIYTQFIFCILYTIYHISYIIYYIYHIYGLFILCILHIYIYVYVFIHSAPAATACSAHMLQSLQHVQGHQLQGLSQAWLLLVAAVRISFRKTCLYDMN